MVCEGTQRRAHFLQPFPGIGRGDVRIDIVNDLSEPIKSEYVVHIVGIDVHRGFEDAVDEFARRTTDGSVLHPRAGMVLLRDLSSARSNVRATLTVSL